MRHGKSSEGYYHNYNQRFEQPARFFAAGYKEIPGYDLAVIILEAQGLPHLQLESTLPANTGDIVTVIGNPLGLSQISQRGTVGAFHRTKSNASPVFELEFPISQGSSGSPVINTQGRVVGIVFASIAESDGKIKDRHGLAIPANVLLEQLADASQR
ncbi:MAG: trypsin-like peptidase domain-containing protein [Syntrophomonadaceae bacterium]|nr:trypsin-like peptidase domain-containing protein [Syntrophomonadaceae bacterium]